MAGAEWVKAALKVDIDGTGAVSERTSGAAVAMVVVTRFYFTGSR